MFEKVLLIFVFILSSLYLMLFLKKNSLQVFDDKMPGENLFPLQVCTMPLKFQSCNHFFTCSIYPDLT